MKSLAWATAMASGAVLVTALSTACHPTFVVLPGPPGDTLVDTVEVDRVRSVVPRTRRIPVGRDTVFRVDTVLRIDTVYRTLRDVRVDTVLRVDTVFRTRTVGRVDTVVRVDTVRLAPPRGRQRPDTIFRVDTLLRFDTIRVAVVDTLLRVDTVSRVDTLRLVRVDTVRVATVDTVVIPGRRLLFVPPGQYPPAGRCRVWIHGLAPGQQAEAAPCTDLGTIPAGAFVLFGAEAWDFEYDWVAEAARNPGTVPPEIIAVAGRGRGD